MTNCLQIEKELESVLTMWENDHERYFVVKDSRYLDTVKNQWEEKNEQKEKEKMQRVGQMVLVSHCIHTAEGGSNGVGFSPYPHCRGWVKWCLFLTVSTLQRVGQMVLVSHCIHTAEGGSNGVGFSLYPHCKLATLLVSHCIHTSQHRWSCFQALRGLGNNSAYSINLKSCV